ncbi:MAG: nucleoside-triphosphatase [Candidatus Woesearchaeota archaeon]|jgi:nucleoside-triphosphatase
MRKNILLTGMPRSGKSTLLERIVLEQQNKVGLLTREVREDGERIGFEEINHLGEKALIASIYFKTNVQISKYFIDFQNLNKLISSVSEFNKSNFLYLDEIGQMQMYSDKFKDLALKYLDSENICLATVSKIYSDKFIDSVKNRNDIILVEITPENREERYEFVTKLIGKIKKAERYAMQPERFIISENLVTANTEHGERHLVKTQNSWKCDCDFYEAHQICSHLIAFEEIIYRNKKG